MSRPKTLPYAVFFQTISLIYSLIICIDLNFFKILYEFMLLNTYPLIIKGDHFFINYSLNVY